MSKKRKAYFIADNGIKIELNGSRSVQSYTKELFPDKKLVGITVREPRLNVALTDELRSKGSVEIKFDFPKE